MAIVLTDLDWDGGDNTGGVQQYFHFIQFSDIQTMPKPIVDDSDGNGNLSDLVTISDNIVMKANKYPYKHYGTLEKSLLDSNLQGERDGKSFMNEFTFFKPGSKAEVLGFSQWMKNRKGIWLVPEHDGQVRIVGSNSFPAFCKDMKITVGGKSGDEKGALITVESARKGPAAIFTGKVLLTGSSVGSGAIDANSNSYYDIVYISGS